MSRHDGSVFSRLSKRSAIRDNSLLAVHLGNDNAMRRLLRDGVGINEVQTKYLSLCYSARLPVRPNKDVAQGLGGGELVWNLTVCEKQETMVIASLLMTKEAQTELRSISISADEAGSSSVRKRVGIARSTRRGSLGSRGGPRERAMERDPVGQVELFNALCKALPQLNAVRSLELEGLRKAFGKSAAGGGAARLARGLAGNSKLKSLAVRHVRLTDIRALGALSTVISRHPTLTTLSLQHCGLVGEASGRLVSSILKAHAARREGMVWSAGLRRPIGVVGHTAAAAPARISTAGCLAVDLSGNRLGDAGVHAIARGLQSDTWLLGLNLAHNKVTDHGAALLWVCLQHNSTLCALVLDDNPEIGQESEKRITEELETRSMMPEAVLEEPEVVLTLAAWGFSAHAGFEGDLPPPSAPRPAAAGSESPVSEISHGSFGGGGHLVGDGLGGPARSVLQPKTPAERKEEMVREFRRWAGYTPHSTQGRGPNADALVNPTAAESAPPASATPGHEDTVRQPRARGRPSTSVLLRGETATSTAPVVAAGGSSRSHGRARARSLSSRSAARAAGSDSSSAGGRLAKRNKSSGPSGRATREQSRGPGTRAVHQKAPWGGGGGNGEVRERTQAWANAHLIVPRRTGRSRCSLGSGSWRSHVRSRKGRAAASGCSGYKVGRGPAKRIEGGGGDGAASGRRTVESARGAASALDVTWDVLDAEGYPELTPRQRRKLFPGSEAWAERPTVASSNGGTRGGGGGGGRTERVVDMLASLEKAVMEVCKDMWRLEDKVEGSERLIASRASELKSENSTALGEGSDRAGDKDKDGGVGDDDDGRDEVVAQVEAGLRRTAWLDAPRPSAGVDVDVVGGDINSNSGGSGNESASAPSEGEQGIYEEEEEEEEEEEDEDEDEEEGEQEEEEQGFGIHAALLLGDSEGDLDAFRPSELLEWVREGTKKVPRRWQRARHRQRQHEGRDYKEEEEEEEGKEGRETLVYALEADSPDPVGVGGDGWQAPLFEEEGSEGGEWRKGEGSLFEAEEGGDGEQAEQGGRSSGGESPPERFDDTAASMSHVVDAALFVEDLVGMGHDIEDEDRESAGSANR